MSGGYVNKDGLIKGQHQVVTFTFKGPADASDCQAWNTAIKALKRSFENHNPGCLIGVTLKCEDTPKDFTGGAKPLEDILKKYT